MIVIMVMVMVMSLVMPLAVALFMPGSRRVCGCWGRGVWPCRGAAMCGA